MERPDDALEVNSIPRHQSDDKLETAVTTLDSGANDAVGQPRTGSRFRVKPTEAPVSGKRRSAANGSVIRNYGQRVIQGRSGEGAVVTVPIKVADVSKVLGSAREFLDAGNRIVLDRGKQGRSCSYLDHKATRHRTAVCEKGGALPIQRQGAQESRG